MPSYTITHELILERVVVPTMRLGRNLHRDSRSDAYPVRRTGVQLTTHRKRLIPVLDQGDVGSCTGNAETGALGSEGTYESIVAILGARSLMLDESFALRVYEAATALDPYPGTYPPNDTGSDGTSVSKVVAGTTNPTGEALISGYVHAASVDDVINGLQHNAGIVGINWYDSFDSPDTDGVLTLPKTARIRGGHELHALNVDMEREVVELVNSWTASWGVNGYCYVPFAVLDTLMQEDGDATFPVPLSEPAPTPTPPSPDLIARHFTQQEIDDIDDWADHPHIWHKATVASRAWRAGT